MTVLPTVRHDLTAAAGRLDRRRTSRRRGTRLAALAAATVLGLGGVAVATGIVPWPKLADDVHVSTTAPPPGQLAVLGVLRRPQTAADRSPAAVSALRISSQRPPGFGLLPGPVRLDAVRVLDTHLGTTYVLIPRTYVSNPGHPLKRTVRRDVLCMALIMRGGASWGSCATTRALLQGLALGSSGGSMWGLVPDRVKAVRYDSCESIVTRPVHNNFVVIDRLPGWTGTGRVTWLDAAGHPTGSFPHFGSDRCIRHG